MADTDKKTAEAISEGEGLSAERRALLALAAALLLALSVWGFGRLAATALAAWPDDPLVNVPLSLAAGEKYDVFAVSYGQGGAIIAWEDERDGTPRAYLASTRF